MKIHQAKKCKKMLASQQRRSSDRQTGGSTQQESNHSVSHTAAGTDRAQMKVADKKPKINWPKASETAKFRQFDETMSVAVSRLRGKPEWKLERMAEILYEEAEGRFGLEKAASGKGRGEGKKKGGPSRRERKIAEVKRDKKRLRKRWIQAEESEKAGLKALYEDIKRKHRQLAREQRRIERKREVKATRKKFLDDPYKFAKGLFTESKAGKLECPKEELESHLAKTYNDAMRDEELQQPVGGLLRPTRPGVPFDLSDLRKKEVDDFIRKARSKSSPGNDGISYKVYKQCPKLRKQLFLLLRQMFRKKDAAERWFIAEGIYLPKEEESKEIGQFRTISLLNVDGKIYFGILAARVMGFVQANGYINETVQKAGVPGIPGCVEHAFAIWDAIQKSKEEKGELSVVWLDLANAYGSVPHKLLKMAMEHFWIPEEIQKLMMKYYDNFMMRFTVGDFTTEWQRLEIGIAAGCPISVIWFILVMEMVIRSTETNGAEIKTPLKAFMDDIAVVSKSEVATHGMLKRLDQLIDWSRMKFKAKKSRSCTFRKGKQVEVRYTIAGEPIPTVREQPVKSLGRMYKGNLSDRGQGVEIFKEATNSLKEIDHAKLPGKFKLWCLQFGLYPRLLWPLMMYEVAVSRVEMIEKKCRAYTRKWLGLPRCLNNAALYGKGIPLELPITSIVEEYKAGKVRTVMMLRYSKDQTIRDDPPDVRTGKRWQAEVEVDRAEEALKHKDIVGAVQTGRKGFGLLDFKPYSMSSEKEKRNAVVAEVRKQEQEKRQLHLVQCAQQGQCMEWQEMIVERKLSWKELWGWGPARTSFLIKSTYDVLPSPANLVRWKVTDDDRCRCGEYGTLRHALSGCKMGLEGGRYTWRHDQVLKVIVEALKGKLEEINKGKLPKKNEQGEVRFHLAGKGPSKRVGERTKGVDKRWEGASNWEIDTDLDKMLIFPIVPTLQRPDIVIWNKEKKVVHLLELTVPWESNLGKAEERKEARYEGLVEACEEEGWTAQHSHLGVGARGYVDRKLLQLFQREMGFTPREVKQLREELQKAAERASLFIWLKRDDPGWLEGEAGKDN